MVFSMNNLGSCEKSTFFCACFEYTLTFTQIKRAKTLSQGVSNWQTSVKIPLSSESYLRVDGLLTLYEERASWQRYRLADNSVRKEDQSYLRTQFLIDLHRLWCFRNSFIFRQPKILLLSANGVCLSDSLKRSI